MTDPNLTADERKIIILLTAAYDAFVELEPQNHIDLHEFAFGVHALQNIVASRLAARLDPELWLAADYGVGRTDPPKKKP